MFRAEALWIAAFLSIGAIGGAVYNWPDNSDDQAASSVSTANGEQQQIDDNVDPSPQSQTARDNPQADSVSPEPGALPVDPDLAPLPLTDSTSEPNGNSPVQGLWSEISTKEGRSQPINFSVLELGDKMLVGGNYVGAYEHYGKLWKRANLPLDTSVLIRLGLASELAGFHEQSLKHYRSAIRVSGTGSVTQMISLLGTARIWHRNDQVGDSIALLSELYLMHANADSPELIRRSIIKELADALQTRLLQTEIVSQALRDEPMEYHKTSLVIQPILDLADLAELPADSMPKSSGIRVLQTPRLDASLIQVEARLGGFSAIKLMTALATQSGLKVELTDKAKSSMVGRLISVQSDAIPISLLLDQALEPLSLVWSQTDETISIMHQDQLTKRDYSSFQLARTQRMLQQVQLNFPNAPGLADIRVAAIMNEGNNHRLSGGWETAAEKYTAARALNPLNELGAKLYFNEASLGLVRGEKMDSLHACYMALDQTLAAKLQGEVYSMIADLELELGQPGKAITAGTRGLRRTDDPDAIARTVLTLARAYLLSGDMDSANQLLFDYSADLTRPSEQRLASVFSTYARYKRSRPKTGLQDEGQRLVLSLASFDPGDAVTFADALIVSNAFESIGLRTKAENNLRVALQSAPEGFWSERVRYALAKMLYEAASLDKANEVVGGFGSVSVEMLPSVLYLQASIQLDMGNLESCESICRRILAFEIDDALKAKTLNKLGQSLERLGDHYASALCYAGYLPEPRDNPNLQPQATTNP